MAKVNNQRDLGAAIRDRRHKFGWTQAGLAGKVGVTRDWVIDLEAGRGNPQLRHLLRALDVLGLRLSVEADGKDQEATSLNAPAPVQQARGMYRGLPVVDLDEVLDAHRRRG